MYGLPINTDLNFLIGQELIQVCIGANDLLLNFSEGCRITILSKCGLIERDKELSIENYPENASLICSLIGEKIADFEIINKGVLILKLNNDRYFVLYDDSDNFESYIIKSSDNEIIV